LKFFITYHRGIFVLSAQFWAGQFLYSTIGGLFVIVRFGWFGSFENDPIFVDTDAGNFENTRKADKGKISEKHCTAVSYSTMLFGGAVIHLHRSWEDG